MFEFNLPTMTCGHCVKAVTQALQELDPHARVDIDLPSHRVSVQTTQPRETVVATLAQAGYKQAGYELG